MNIEEIIGHRLFNNFLINKAISQDEVLNRTLGIQAQYANHGLYNLWNRLDIARIQPLLMGWGQRNTLHYYTYAGWQKVNQFLAEETRWPHKYMQKHGIDLEANLLKLESILTNEPGLKRQELKPYFKDDWQQLTNWSAMFVEASRRGQLYLERKAAHSTIQHFHWTLPNHKKIFSQEEVLGRYLKAYGPASVNDMVHFFGVNLSFLKLDLSEHFPYFIINNKPYYYVDIMNNISLPEVILLGKFDPLLVAYRDKKLLIPERYIKSVWRKAGQISAVILIHGKFAGVWRYQQKGPKIDFIFESLVSLTTMQKSYIKARCEAFTQLLGKTVKHIHFARFI